MQRLQHIGDDVHGLLVLAALHHRNQVVAINIFQQMRAFGRMQQPNRPLAVKESQRHRATGLVLHADGCQQFENSLLALIRHPIDRTGRRSRDLLRVREVPLREVMRQIRHCRSIDYRIFSESGKSTGHVSNSVR
jgi:hypothetical protein